MRTVVIKGYGLTLEEMVAVSRHGAKVELAPEAVEKVLASRKIVEDFVDNEAVVYGITTGFGKFSNVSISKADSKLLQKNLIVTHAVGAGEPFSMDIARGILLLRINNLSKGYSGTKIETIQTMIDMLNKNVTPVIPEKGSLGASGDLAPLSHMSY